MGHAAGSGSRLRQGLRFSHAYLTLDAAAAGQGVAVVSDVFAADAVRRKLLSVAPGKPVPGPYTYHLLTTRAAAAQPRVKVFCDWLRAQAVAFSRRGWPRPARAS
jgi:LysR family transcriptional regulator, glycine cleavage system transcriptional activator